MIAETGVQACQIRGPPAARDAVAAADADQVDQPEPVVVRGDRREQVRCRVPVAFSFSYLSPRKDRGAGWNEIYIADDGKKRIL